MNRLGLLLLALAGCSGATGAPSSPSDKDGPPHVEVVRVEERRLDTAVRLQGELSAYESVGLYSRVQGYVDEMLVDRGSKVKRGQVLARLSAPDMIAKRIEAESQAQGDASTFESLKAASKTPGAVAEHDLEIAAAKFAASRARVAELRSLESYLIVRAPFDGLITERNVHPGALVGPPAGGATAPLLRIEQVSRLRLTVAVPEADVGAVVPGGEAEFVVSAWPGERFSGIISRLSKDIDIRSRTMPVEMDVNNEDLRLTPGMFADVLWPVRRSSASLWVPTSAVVQTAERTYVDRVSDGEVQVVHVRRGAVVASSVEVFGPLQKGDSVLVRGSEELREGTRVVVQEGKKEK